MAQAILLDQSKKKLNLDMNSFVSVGSGIVKKNGNKGVVKLLSISLVAVVIVMWSRGKAHDCFYDSFKITISIFV